MPHLNAFVGYSFAADDQPVVATLLALLDSVKNVMPEFAWDHAEAAEPKVLSAKVREKMKGKNLFIGICTAREQTLRATRPAGFMESWLLPKTRLAVERDSIETKTSDWIIQEIGFALGSNMDLILLVEEGVRRPGGLQGDLEYIPFTRKEPEKCFKKLSSMLGMLSQSPKSAVEASAKPTANKLPEGAPQNDLFLQVYLSPDPSWTVDTYVARLRFSITIDEPEYQTKISEAFRISPFHQDEEARVAFDAAGISMRALVYKEEWIPPLVKLTVDHPEYPGPYLALAERLAASSEYARAAENYELAAQRSKSPNRKIELLVEAAAQQTNAKQPATAESFLRLATELIRSNPKHEADGLARMSHVWKKLGRTGLFLACAERCLELEPDRMDPRFALAFAYAELNLSAEALFHYRQYLLAKNDPAAWNNLGVAASSLKLPVTAIDAFTRADKEGNTLATSNLAFEKLDAGFADEATELCNRGLLAQEPNPRLLEALAKCQRAQEDESTKESELLEGTRVRREVLRATGKASLVATPDQLRGTWLGPNCELAATFDAPHLVMKGTYQRNTGTLGSLLSGLASGGTETVTVEYIGELYGSAFVGKVKTAKPSTIPTALSLLDDEGSDCLGYLESDCTTLVIFENGKRYPLTAVNAIEK